ncbi:MAG: hypothetical protein K8S21_01800 [Gemmatimonadetes bacterium]|nr:hypothetical protein [Gemmatimonadota bacterium]
MRVRMLLVGLILPTLLAAQQGPACGVERWPVKILNDADRDSVALVAEPTTIAALVDLPEPREARPARGRLAMERRTFRIRGILVETRAQSDLDLHLILADPADPTKRLVAEIPDSACALGSRHASDFAEARRVVDRLPRDIVVEVTGVAFWDSDHGQTGNAENGIELHPVLRVEPVLNKNDILRMEVGADPPDPTEVRVWLNLSSKVYHCPGSASYGTTSRGAYMPESAAVRAGGRPAGGRRCGSGAPLG